MAETSTERANAIQTVMAATANESPEAREAALNSVIQPPSQAAADKLWKILVVGLLVLVLVSLGGLIFMVGDGDSETSPDIVLTAFTALLTGLLGLFIKSPVTD
jgi:hypothetical protein